MKIGSDVTELSDYGRSMAVDANALTKEMAALRAQIDKRKRQRSAAPRFVAEPGVSVIVATHDGSDRLATLLESLARQTLSPSRFEVVVVENGEPDGTANVVAEFQSRFAQHCFRYIWRNEASAGGARNIGIQVAKMSRTTFVDDDDQLEENYLADALSVSTGTNLVVSPIVDVTADGERNVQNPLNMRIAGIRGGSVEVATVPWLLGFNACKLVPTWMIRNLRYREDLRSGEDLVFWAQLLVRKNLEAVVAPSLDRNAYLRGKREDSVSRKQLTRDFAVSQRLDCIRALREVKVPHRSVAKGGVDALASAQAGFIVRYLEGNPNERDEVIDQIEAAAIVDFPWSSINRNLARDLAFVYCFAPFSDTSAVVAAKAIAERRRVVDVITNDMAAVRKFDPAVSALADKWIDRTTIIDSKPAFADWSLITEFAERAVEAAEKAHAQNGGYRTVYSRALWAGSHVAGALFKLRHWSVEWTAEFSDPLRRDVNGAPRQGAYADNEASRELLASLHARGYEDVAIDTLFDLIEIATFVLADRLLFTNEQQLEYMLSQVSDAALRECVKEKAIVRQHPAPTSAAYHVQKSDYTVAPGCINIGYFGNFYPNRGIGDVLQAIANSSPEVRRAVRLHVFSNKRAEVQESAKSIGVGANVYSNEYLPYMEFLNATTKFDVLLVNDVERSPNLPVNPFLPSKVSDYLGSGRPIWAIVDDSSPMSYMDFAFKTGIGSVPQLVAALEYLVATIPSQSALS